MNNKKDYVKKIVKYGYLTENTMKSLLIILLGFPIFLIILTIYDALLGISLNNFTGIFIAFVSIILLGIIGIYFAIRFTIANNKLKPNSLKKVTIGQKEVEENLQELRTIGIPNDLLKILNLDKSIIGTTTSIITAIKMENIMKKNSNLLLNSNLISDQELKKYKLYKNIILLISIISILFLDVGTLIDLNQSKKNIETKLSSINKIIQNNFSNYNLYTYDPVSGPTQLNLKNFAPSYGKDFYILSQNKKISFELNNDVNIIEFNITLQYNKSENLNINEIKNELQKEKDKIDQYLGTYYNLEAYKTSNIVFNNECINLIQNKIDDIASIDEVEVNKPIRHLTVRNKNEIIEIEYSFMYY